VESLDEFVPPKALSKLTVSDVVRMRTRAWGKEGAARMRLFRAVARLTEECRDLQALRTRLRSEIDAYNNSATDLVTERKKIGWKAVASIASGVAIPTLETLSGYISAAVAHAIINPAGVLVGGLTAIGGLTFAVAPHAVDYKGKRKKFEQSVGFALLSPYAPLKKQ
jgi:hypothetical protein